MLSTEGNDNIRLYIWNGKDGLRRLSTDGVDVSARYYFAASDRVGEMAASGFTWMSNNTVIANLLPDGVAPTEFDQAQRTDQIARSGAEDAMRGSRGNGFSSSLQALSLGSHLALLWRVWTS